MSTLKGNQAVAKNRGSNWRENLIKGHLNAKFNPTVLKVRRIEKRISQADFAKLLKVSLSTYGAIELGKRPASAIKALAITSKLGGKRDKYFKETAKKRFLAINLN